MWPLRRVEGRKQQRILRPSSSLFLYIFLAFKTGIVSRPGRVLYVVFKKVGKSHGKRYCRSSIQTLNATNLFHYYYHYYYYYYYYY